MDLNPRLKNHNTRYNNQEYFLDDIQNEHLGDEKMEFGMVATDMDGTMFRNDLGVLTFIHMLKDPHSWTMHPDEFKAIITPIEYMPVLRLGENGKIPALDSDDCKLFFDLRGDVIDLYKELSKYDDEQDLTIDNPIVNEFACKMIKIDQLVLGMEGIFHLATKGQLLMRTRFLKGRKVRNVRKFVKRMVGDHANGERYEIFSVYDENLGRIEQRVGPERLEPIRFDKQIQIIESIRSVLFSFLQKGVPVRVVTTSLKTITTEVLKNTSYKPLLDQDCDGKQPLCASALSVDEYNFIETGLEKEPVFGEIKVERLKALEQVMAREVIVTVGDSPTNDSPMMRHSIMNGGIVILRGDNYLETRAKFKLFVDSLKIDMCNPDIGKRIFYSTDD